MTVEVELRRRGGKPSLYALVDDEDAERVLAHRWRAIPGVNTTYASRHVRRDGVPSTQTMHSFLMGQPGVDHVNGDGLDNRRSNLRLADHHQNGANSAARRGSSSAYKGVGLYRQTGKWRAQIQVHSKRLHIGYYDTEEGAARAYDAEAVKHFGPFARTNFPRSTT